MNIQHRSVSTPPPVVFVPPSDLSKKVKAALSVLASTAPAAHYSYLGFVVLRHTAAQDDAITILAGLKGRELTDSFWSLTRQHHWLRQGVFELQNEIFVGGQVKVENVGKCSERQAQAKTFKYLLELLASRHQPQDVGIVTDFRKNDFMGFVLPALDCLIIHLAPALRETWKLHVRNRAPQLFRYSKVQLSWTDEMVGTIAQLLTIARKHANQTAAVIQDPQTVSVLSLSPLELVSLLEQLIVQHQDTRTRHGHLQLVLDRDVKRDGGLGQARQFALVLEEHNRAKALRCILEVVILTKLGVRQNRDVLRMALSNHPSLEHFLLFASQHFVDPAKRIISKLTEQ